jgi:DNA replication protein DnaC
MKPLKNLMNLPENDSRAGNLPTSSSPDVDMPATGTCPSCGQRDLCGGIGYVRYDLPVGDPNFGKLFRCPNYKPAAGERRETLRRLGNLDVFRDRTLDNFMAANPEATPGQQQSLQQALDAVRQYAAQPTGWLLLEGPYGSGKTHLAAAVGNLRLEREESVIFITAPDLLDHLRHTYTAGSDMGYDDMFDRIKNAPMLILDDLGAENPSGWAQEKLFQLLNYRYNYRLPTVITTNTDLNTMDQRISSRLRDLSVIRRIVINAPDYRSPGHSNIGALWDFSLYREMTFQQFDTRSALSTDYRENLERVANAAWEYAAQPTGWLFIMGESGTGKTHLAASIANQFAAQGGSVIFVTAPDLLDHLRLTFSPNSNVTFDHRFNEVKNAPLLVLDDLGTESASAWAKEKLFQIVNHRYLTRMATVFTTSKDLTELDVRLRTRILDRRICRVMAITAPSFPSRMNRKPAD